MSGGNPPAVREHNSPVGFRKRISRTVQQFVSNNCAASIRSVLPGQFLDITIADVMQVARSSDRAARTCLKVLGRERFRK